LCDPFPVLSDKILKQDNQKDITGIVNFKKYLCRSKAPKAVEAALEQARHTGYWVPEPVRD
jgi:hypothetical protein